MQYFQQKNCLLLKLFLIGINDVNLKTKGFYYEKKSN